MHIWGVVPVKRFDAAKSRLSSVLGDSERAALARSLFEHVLTVLGSCPELAGVSVVTDSAEVADLAAARGAVAVRDPEGTDALSDKIDFALDELAARGVDAAMVLMSDLPDLRVADVQLLTAELARVDMVIVRDARGEHTNALCLRLQPRQPTAFGARDSFQRHCQAAALRGLSVATPEVPTIAFDIDTPEDLARHGV
jgi:2-phospho-L-lactate guanylyltransferase